jgi:hypothetical protein
VLQGKDPKLPISTAELEAMPLLNSFVRETMRVYPPCRPAARVLKADLAVGAVKLPAGTLIAPEPFVAHFDPECFAEPLSFDPTRFGAPGAPAPLLLPFASAPTDALGGAAAAPAGERLAISAAKAAYVQLRRMFDQVQLGAEPSPVPSGYPLHTIDERVDAPEHAQGLCGLLRRHGARVELRRRRGDHGVDETLFERRGIRPNHRARVLRVPAQHTVEQLLVALARVDREARALDARTAQRLHEIDEVRNLAEETSARHFFFFFAFAFAFFLLRFSSFSFLLFLFLLFFCVALLPGFL